MPKFRNICMRDCYDRCFFYSIVERGVLKKVYGAPEHPITKGFLCPKGHILPQYVHHKERLTQPLIREDTKFKKISLEDAIKILVEEIEKARPDKSYYIYYAGNMGLVESFSLKYLFSKLKFNIAVGNLCSTSGNNALREIFGTFNGQDVEEIPNKRLIIVWGMNPAWTNLHGMLLIKEAIKNGAKLWVVDPNRTTTAKQAHKHIRIKPSTDAIFAIGMAKFIVKEELYDKRFVKSHFKSYEEFFAFLENFPTKQLEKTGLSISEIRDLAYKYATTRPNWIHIGYGFQRQIGGGDAIKAIAYLPALIGDPSAFYYDFSPNINFESVLGLQPTKVITFSEIYDIIEKEGADFVFVGFMNPVYTAPRALQLEKLLKENVNFLVVYDLFLTETAKLANLVIPSTSFLEAEDVAISYFHRYIGLNEKAIDPPGESIDSFSLAKKISEKLNIEFPWSSREELISKITSCFGIDLSLLRKSWFVKLKNIKEAFEIVYKPIKIEYESEEPGKFRLMVLSYSKSISSQYTNILDPDDNIYLNPNDAKSLGIKNGDFVEIYNSNGSIVGKVMVSEDIYPGVVVVYKGARFFEKTPNVLTENLVDRYGVIAYHTCKVHIRKFGDLGEN